MTGTTSPKRTVVPVVCDCIYIYMKCDGRLALFAECECALPPPPPRLPGSNEPPPRSTVHMAGANVIASPSSQHDSGRLAMDQRALDVLAPLR